MAQYDYANTVIRLLDKTQQHPTGTTDGGLVNGDLKGTKKIARLVIEESSGKVPTATLSLKMSTNGQFITSAPILTDKDTFSKYLLEVQIAQKINGVVQKGRLHRFNLSTPSEVQDNDLGWILQIPCEHVAAEAINETYLALNQELVAPKTRIASLLFYYNTPRVDVMDVQFVYDTDADILLPNQDSLKQDYFPNSQQTLGESFQTVLDRLKQAGPIGGTFTDYYWYVESDPTWTMFVHIHFEQFGLNDSGVTISSINAQQASLTDRTNQTSNKKRKNKIVVKYHPLFGSIPEAFQKYASSFAHASNRTEWNGSTLYKTGDTVKYTFKTENPYVIRYFQCRVDMVVNLGPPDQNSTQWKEDFTIIPNWSADARYEVGDIIAVPGLGAISFYRAIAQNGPTNTPPPNGNWVTSMATRTYSTLVYTDFASYTPYTNTLDAFKASLCGTTGTPAGYLGFVPDWNYERQINDMVDYTNRFLLVSGKAFKRMTNSVPTGRELYNGMRVIVGTAPAGVFIGHTNQIAEFSLDTLTATAGGSWQFSNSPVTNDTVFCTETAEMWKFDGANWVVVWSASANNDKPGVFHAVKNAYLVRSATNIPGQAVRYVFNLADASQGGNDINKTSRFAGINMFYPYPQKDVPSGGLGYLYGGDGVNAPLNPQVDHQNLNFTRTGQFGLNQTDSESVGRISAHALKLRIGYWQSADESDSSQVYGKANIPMVYWRKDANGRFFFQDFIMPENYQWNPVTIRLPPFAPVNLYFNRLNELVTLFGYTLPVDFFIQEKEYAGIKYDWRRNQSWGIMTKESFLATGMYQGCYRNIFDQAQTVVNQVLPISIKGIEDLAVAANPLNSEAQRKAAMDDFNGLNINPAGVDHITIDLDELHYIKEGIAIYPEGITEEPRMDLVHFESETDYLTAKAKAQAQYIEDQFFPNERYPNITGNILIKYGYLVTETGVRIPGGTLTSVVASKRDIIDNKGLNQELYLIRKFVIT